MDSGECHYTDVEIIIAILNSTVIVAQKVTHKSVNFFQLYMYYTVLYTIKLLRKLLWILWLYCDCENFTVNEKVVSKSTVKLI